MFLHKAIDLTDGEAACFAVLQSHRNQTAEENTPGKINKCYAISPRWNLFMVYFDRGLLRLTYRSRLVLGKTWAADPGFVEPGGVA